MTKPSFGAGKSSGLIRLPPGASAPTDQNALRRCEIARVRWSAGEPLQAFEVVGFSGEELFQTDDEPAVAELGCLIDAARIAGDGLLLGGDILREQLARVLGLAGDSGLDLDFPTKGDDLVREEHRMLQLTGQLGLQ